MISNPLQHKGKGRPSNKRYLSEIENHTMKYSKSSNHHDEPAEGSKKRNKRQCSLCKSWYHDSRNCPLKNKPNLEDETCNDKKTYKDDFFSALAFVYYYKNWFRNIIKFLDSYLYYFNKS